MNVTLLVPDLHSPPAPLAEIGDLPALPAMRRILGRADRGLVPGSDLDGTLCWLTGFETLPAGALTALAAGKEPGDTHWLRTDPVHLAADADGLRLVGGDALAITDDEAAALVAWLSTQQDVPFHVADPAYWFVPFREADVELQPPWRALGRAVEGMLPHGDEAVALRKWVNELQMLLHDHPVNTRRRDRGDLTINSVWPWGAGALTPTDAPWPYAWTYSDEPVLTGVAEARGRHATAVPRGLAQVSEEGPALVRIDTVQAASRLRAVERWIESLAELERDWFAPALERLATGSLREFTVLDGAGRRWTMRPGMRWRFWRRDGGLETD